MAEETSDAAEAAESAPETGLPPVVVDLGKVKRKRVKQLKQGEGKLLGEVDTVVAMLREELAGDLDGREILPVVLIYEKRPKKKRGWFDF